MAGYISSAALLVGFSVKQPILCNHSCQSRGKCLEENNLLEKALAMQEQLRFTVLASLAINKAVHWW